MVELLKMLVMYLGKFIKLILTEPEANSRIVFLAQGVGSAVAIAVIGVGFVHHIDSPNRDVYITMMATVLGGGSFLHVGRAISKKAAFPATKESNGNA